MQKFLNPRLVRQMRSVWLVASLSLTTLLTACAHAPSSGPYVRSVAIEGVRNVSASKLKHGLQTQKNRPFEELALERDRTRVQRFYEQNGYFATRVTHAEGKRAPNSDAVDVVIAIEEGPATRIGDVKVFGLDQLDEKTRKRLQQYQLGQRRGQVFQHEYYANFKHSLTRELKKRGYADTKVEGVVDILPADNLANITVTLFPRGVSAERASTTPVPSQPENRP